MRTALIAVAIGSAGLLTGALLTQAFNASASAPATAPTTRAATWAVEWAHDRNHPVTDDIKIQALEDAMIIHVTNQRGIDGVVINLTQGNWPPNITFKFHNFGNMENFSGGGAKYIVAGKLGPGGDLRATVLDGQNRRNIEMPRGSKASIKAVAEKEIEIEIPALVTQDAGGKLRFDWIDAYRR
jgi:hypothetical protein